MLVDTSAWIRHQRQWDPRLDALLESERALTHSVVVGELSLGCGDKTRTLVAGVEGLMHVTALASDRVRDFVAAYGLACTGLSWPDACMLAAAAGFGGVRVYTYDRSMESAARRIGIAWP